MKASFLVSITVLITYCYGAPQVKIGGTTLVGRDVTILKQDFFGGEYMVSLLYVFKFVDCQEYHMPSLLSEI